MTIQAINTGFEANDGTGDAVRDAFIKVNDAIFQLDNQDYFNARIFTSNLIFGNVFTFNSAVFSHTIIANEIQANLITYDSILTLTNTTPATDTTSGALQVAGGASIAQDLYVGGTIYGSVVGSLSVPNIDNTIIGALVPSTAVFTQVNVVNTTQSISSNSGALIVYGGVGINRNLYVGGNIVVGNLAVTGKVNGRMDFYTSGGGGVYVDGSPVATSAATFTGGTVPLQAIFSNVLASTSSGTGTIVVAGGVGVGGNATISGNLSVVGTITAGGQFVDNRGVIVGSSGIFSNNRIAGTLLTATQTSITSVGTLTGLSIGGNVSSGIGSNQIYIGTIDVPFAQVYATRLTATTIDGTLSTSAQPQITSVGTLAGVTTSANIRFNIGSDAGITTNSLAAYLYNETAQLIKIGGGGVTAFDNNTQATSTTTGAVRILGGLGVGGNVYIRGSAGRSITASGNVVIANGVDSTSTTTGALVIQGGIGATGTNYFAGDTQFASADDSTSTTTGAVVITGGLGVGGNIFASSASLSGNVNSGNLNTGIIAATGNITSGNLTTTNINVSSNIYTSYIQTGSISVGGGAGAIDLGTGSIIAGQISGNIYSSNIAVTGTNAATSTTTGALIIAGGIGAGGNIYSGNNIDSAGNIIVQGATISTSSTTGALTVAGGAGIAGNVYIGGSGGNAIVAAGDIRSTGNIVTVGNLRITGGDSAGNTSGAVVIQGGLGISGNLYSNGAANFGGNITTAGYIIGSIVGSISTPFIDNTRFGKVGPTEAGFTNVTMSGNLGITDATAATSSTTGALKVTGGISTQGNVIAAGNVLAANVAVSGNVSAQYIFGTVVGSINTIAIDGTRVGKNIPVEAGFTNVTMSGNLTINDATDATDGYNFNTGALKVVGGISTQANLYVKGNIVIGDPYSNTGSVYFQASNKSNSSSTGAVLLFNGAGMGIDGNLHVYEKAAFGSNVHIKSNLVANSTNISTSITTGSFVARGGAGIAGNVYIGGSGGNAIIATGTITPSSNTAGSLGTSSLYWNNLFAVAAQTGSTTTNTLTVTGATTLTSSNITIGGAGGNAVVANGSITPAANSSASLGAATLYYTNLYSVAGSLNQLTVGGQGVTSSSNIAVNTPVDAAITTTTTVAEIFNSAATTVKIAGAGTTVSIGAATGNVGINNGLTVSSSIVGSGNIAVNNPTNAGLTTTQATAYVFNEVATNVRIGGGGTTYLASNTQSIDTTTGAVVQIGGHAIRSGNLYVGGSGGNAIIATGTLWATQTVGNAAVFNGVTWKTGNIQSISNTTGDIVTRGGIAVSQGNVYIGGSGGNSIVATGTLWTTQTVGNAAVFNGTAWAVGNVQSISATTGDIVTRGGAAIGGNLNIGGSGGNAIIATGNITPTSNGVSNLGSPTLYFNNIFSVNGTFNTLNITGTALNVNGSILPIANLVPNLGSATSFFGTTFTGNIVSNSQVIGGGGLISAGNIRTPALTTSQAAVYVYNETASNISIGGGGTTYLASNTQSISSTSGALFVTGGIAVKSGNIYVGGSGGNALVATGNIYAQGVWDNSVRVVSYSIGPAGTLTIQNGGINLSVFGPGVTTVGNTISIPVITTDLYGRVSALSSSLIKSVAGAGNVTINGVDGTITLTTTGPGAGTFGSASAIPVITTDAYGRISSISASTISTTLSVAGSSGTGSVALGSQTLTITGASGVSVSALNQTLTIATPQDLQVTASPGFVSLNLSSSLSVGTNNTTGNAAVFNGAGNVWISGNILPGPGVTRLNSNIGSYQFPWNTVYATATSAQYADLAENYVSDFNYSPGSVVVIGGDKEITVTTKDHDTRVAGVISTNPAYLMNSIAPGLPVALTGRVPCRVIGPISKGDLLVTSPVAGIAQKLIDDRYRPGCVLGKSLENIYTSEMTIIEIMVGRY